MGKTKDLAATKIAEIKALIGTKSYSNREISRQLNISESSVRRIKKKIDLGLVLTSQRKKKCGRKPIFSARSERCLKKICLENRFSTTKEIKCKLESTNVSVSERTLRRKLSAMNFKAHRPARKPKLIDTMKSKRLKWARDHKNRDLNFWKSVNILLDVFFLQ